MRKKFHDFLKNIYIFPRGAESDREWQYTNKSGSHDVNMMLLFSIMTVSLYQKTLVIRLTIIGGINQLCELIGR